MRSRFCTFSLLFCVSFLLTIACNSALQKPTIVLSSPPHGSQFSEGEEIVFQSLANDNTGITRVELLVNGATVRTDPAPSPQSSFAIVQKWKAIQGTHTISVRAYNIANVMSDPAAISISVVAAPSTPAPTSAPPPTLAPTIPATSAPTAPPAKTTDSACTNNASFVADVTVPDGTAFVANQAFNKIWRLKNTGTCTWGNDYQFVFAGGEAMAATTAIAVPHTSAGATGDLLIAMVAPAAVGTHTGQWRLKAPNGALFGSTVSVVINVVDLSTPGPTTVPPTPVPPSGACSGAPAISTFTVSPTSLFSTYNVTLSWGAVTNADSVEIDQGVGGVGTPGSVVRNVTPPITFTMTARCGANVATRQVTVSKLNLLPATFVVPLLPIFIVTDVTASSSYLGLSFCGSKHYTFTGTVKATSHGDVQYRWEKDGVSQGNKTLHFDAADTKPVSSYSFTPTASKTSGVVRLHVTSPTDKASSNVNYSCTDLNPWP